MISEGTKKIFNSFVCFINQPVVKESVKNCAGSITFVFGIVEIYDIYKIVRGRKISTDPSTTSPKWIQVANKVVIVCAKISLILSSCVSRPGIFIISSLTGCFFSTIQLDRIFEPNTIFTLNPWHPRHIISIAAAILALPAVSQSLYNGIDWMYRKVCHYQNISTDNSETNNWLTHSKIRFMTLFNTTTSRPALHIGNQLARFMLRPI